MPGFDPLENAKRGGTAPTTSVSAPPPPPSTPGASSNGHAASASVAVAAEVLEKARHKLEGTPVHYPSPPSKQVVVMEKSTSKPPVGKHYRVVESQVIHVRGGLTKLAKDSIVTEASHDIEALKSQKVKLEPVDS